MQQLYLGLGLVSSSDAPSLSSRVRPLAWPRAAPRWRALVPPASACRREQDHYAVLGLRRDASAAEVKKAYRLLARKYHPDVSKDAQAGEVFKSVRLAYEVLSDEGRRSEYDRELEFLGSTGRHYKSSGYYQPEIDMNDRRRMYRWAELRQQMQYEYYQRQTRSEYRKRKAEAYSRQQEEACNQDVDHERGPFSDVLWSAVSMFFFLEILGARLTLALSALAVIFDASLDASYKMGHIVALALGGRHGILLSICISFVTWFCGKKNSRAVILPLTAMWVVVNLAMSFPIPRGAVLVMLYESLNLP